MRLLNRYAAPVRMMFLMIGLFMCISCVSGEEADKTVENTKIKQDQETEKDHKEADVQLADSFSEVARQGTYVAYKNGIVKDTNTGLEWFVGPDEDTKLDRSQVLGQWS